MKGIENSRTEEMQHGPVSGEGNLRLRCARSCNQKGGRGSSGGRSRQEETEDTGDHATLNPGGTEGTSYLTRQKISPVGRLIQQAVD